VVLTAPPFAAASAVRQSPVRSTRPGCASTERVRRVPLIAGSAGYVMTVTRLIP
jgi:hypothetical protein